jgi:hypothetical protein
MEILNWLVSACKFVLLLLLLLLVFFFLPDKASGEQIDLWMMEKIGQRKFDVTVNWNLAQQTEQFY